MKFQLTTDGDLIIYNLHNQSNNNNLNNYYSMESLMTYQEQRIRAMEEHIQMLEEECKALYDQMDNCNGQCKLTITD
tara:strand:+ start:823 stop:1053 length:231 start_codon:yes stop_codon:yes gene_type:complete